jgi:DNA-binding NarL/FixJ family response regulator
MPANAVPGPIRIGLIADEPLRVAGLVSIFEQPAEQSGRQLLPVIAGAAELLSRRDLEYIVIDLHGSFGVESLGVIRKARPDIRMIVIGPEGDEELVIKAIVAGARGYLDLTAGPDMVRQAIEVVTSGSIWAPRRLLSRLIDRLLKTPDSSLTSSSQLTMRERQVLELILMARSNREIAAQLGIEERTVKAYVGTLMRKTGSDNRIKLTMSALSQELFPEVIKRREGRADTPPRPFTD